MRPRVVAARRDNQAKGSDQIMQSTFRQIALSFCIALAVLSWLSGKGIADPVNEALKQALESAKQTMNANSGQTQNETSAQPQNEDYEQITNNEQTGAADTAAQLQAAYPGVENKILRTGGNGEPSSTIWYPSVGNEKVDAKLKEFAESQSKEYENEVKDSIGDDEEKPESWSTWEQTGFFTAEWPNSDVISIIFNVYSYIGGAHGQLLINVFNFNLKTGDELALSDLFADPQKAIAIMSELCASKLRQSLGEDADEDMIKDGTEPTEANFGNLSLTSDGLSVEFQPYQVGPWSIGQQQVNLTLEELAPAGPSPAIWPSLSSASTVARP